MPSRKFHRKTRHGCENCKRRKIKCGEERPACQHCVRLGGSVCTFLSSDSMTVTSTSSITLTSSTERTASLDTTSAASTELQLYNTDLIKNYSTSTCFTMTDKVDLYPVWQITIPCLGLSHPFLHHGLLAISAMHLASKDTTPDQDLYVRLGRQHQARALATYIKDLQSIREENHSALFAFSAIVVSLAYAFLRFEDDVGDDFVGQIINVFDYMIGTTQVATQAKTWIRGGVLSPILEPKALGNNLPQVDEDPKLALETLLEAAENIDPKDSPIDLSTASFDGGSDHQIRKTEVYTNAIEKLSNVFHRNGGLAPDFAAVFGWPVFVDRRYSALLKKRDPFALVILAYYGAALHNFNHFWQLAGLGIRLVEAVRGVLGEAWMPLLSWPVSKTLQLQGADLIG